MADWPIGRIDHGAGVFTDSAIDAMGDRLTVGTGWLVPNVRGDVAALLDPAAATISDAYRYDGQVPQPPGQYAP